MMAGFENREKRREARNKVVKLDLREFYPDSVITFRDNVADAVFLWSKPFATNEARTRIWSQKFRQSTSIRILMVVKLRK